MSEVTVRTQVALSQADEMMDKIFEMDPIVTNAYWGDTTQHIKKRTGFTRSLTKKFLIHRLSGAGVTATLEADARQASAPTVEELEITRTYLRRIDHTIERSVLATDTVVGGKHAIWDLGAELSMETLQNLDEKENQLINSDGDAMKGLVEAKYSTLGAVYSQADTAIFTVKSGGIANITEGEVLHIRDATAAYAVIAEVQVRDVFHDTDVLGNALSYPSIRVTLTDTATSYTCNNAGHLDAVAADDEIAHQGDALASGFEAAFSAMCDTDRSDPSTYFGVTRTAAGKAYLMPYGHNYTSGGADVALNLETVMDKMSITMGRFINPTRKYLRNSGLKFSDAIVCQVPPELMPSIERQAGADSRRFTIITPSTLDDAKRRKLIAVDGWNGVVVQTFNLPPIAFQLEPQMKPNTIRFFEPAVMEWLQLGANSRQPRWLRNDNGGRWHVKRSASTGRLQMALDAVCWRIVAPFCSVPRLTYEATGLAAG